MSLIRQIQEATRRLAHIHSWSLTDAAFETFCSDVLSYATRARVQTETAIISLAWTFHEDGPLVSAALEQSHPDHDVAWTTLHDQIVGWLYRRGYYPQDALMLDEFSPDLCAMEDLRNSLREFNYGCRLTTYVQRVTERTTQAWLRSHAALKRGGGGVTSAAARRCADPQAVQRTWSTCYLSQPIGADRELAWDDVLPAPQADTPHIVEDQALIQEIEQAVLDMKRDPCYPILVKVWRDLLLEQSNVTALARQCGVPTRTMFNVKDRLTRRLLPLVQHWAAGE